MSESCVYLKGVDLSALVERYLRGEFITLTTPLPVDISSLEEQPTSVITVNDKSSKISYEFDPCCGRNFMCIGYKVLEKNGQYAVLDPNQVYNCMNCLIKIEKNPLGIPIRREQKNGKIYYHMIDIFCSFECVVSELRKRLNNTLYSNSMCYISELYTLCTGKDASTLYPASDHRLLKIFNGPLTWEEYHRKTTRYSEKPGNVIFLPVVEYLEQDSFRGLS